MILAFYLLFDLNLSFSFSSKLPWAGHKWSVDYVSSERIEYSIDLINRRGDELRVLIEYFDNETWMWVFFSHLLRARL